MVRVSLVSYHPPNHKWIFTGISDRLYSRLSFRQISRVWFRSTTRSFLIRLRTPFFSAEEWVLGIWNAVRSRVLLTIVRPKKNSSKDQAMTSLYGKRHFLTTFARSWTSFTRCLLQRVVTIIALRSFQRRSSRSENIWGMDRCITSISQMGLHRGEWPCTFPPGHGIQCLNAPLLDSTEGNQSSTFKPHLQTQSTWKIYLGCDFLENGWISQGLFDIAMKRDLEFEYMTAKPFSFDQGTISTFKAKCSTANSPTSPTLAIAIGVTAATQASTPRK